MGSSKSNIELAEEIKLRANEAFKANKFSQAIDLYSQAIDLNENNAVYWANRAFAHIKLEEYGSAIQDATKAIEIDPRYSKGYYRRGAAYLAMGKFKEALKDFQQVKRICPNDPVAARKLKECEKAVQKIRFEEAIAVADTEKRSIADSIDYRCIEVDPQYTGARIEGEAVTLDFVKKMIDDFRNQKSLHKRYAFQIVLKVREILRALPSLVDVTVPDGQHFTVCGDVHGQQNHCELTFQHFGLIKSKPQGRMGYQELIQCCSGEHLYQRLSGEEDEILQLPHQSQCLRKFSFAYRLLRS